MLLFINYDVYNNIHYHVILSSYMCLIIEPNSFTTVNNEKKVRHYIVYCILYHYYVCYSFCMLLTDIFVFYSI